MTRDWREGEGGILDLNFRLLDTAGLDDVRALFKKPLSLTVAPGALVVDAINRVYERGATMSELEPTEKADDDEEIDILDSDEDAPIILSGVPGNSTGTDTAASVYNPVGRTWYLGMNFKF